MFITLYCNPFFPGCKEKFSQIHQFFAYFFEREKKNSQNAKNSLPKSGKQGGKKFPKGQLPQDAATQQSTGVADAQIPAADGKAQIDPQGKESGDKQQISQPPGAKGSQKPIKKSQQRP